MGPSGSETILVVDDAEAIRRMICLMLTQAGYRCLEASDGTEALRLLDSPPEAVHLMLTDVVMPGMNGSELARHVSALRPSLRIVFMSGYSDEPACRFVQDAPAVFLAKPFTANSLIEKVRTALERPWTGLPGSKVKSMTD